MDNEESLQTAIQTYKLQLSQVEITLDSAIESEKVDLELLQADLKQLIQITEESLLAMKKSRLLAMLDAGNLQMKSTIKSSSSEEGSSSAADMEKEFAAFQHAVGNTSSVAAESSKLTDEAPLNMRLLMYPHTIDSGDECVDEDSYHVDDVNDNANDDESMASKKCRAPYSHSWGEMTYHNALVLCHEADDSQVRVLYCNPTHNSMRPCPYFLEGSCRYDDLHCRFSHGEVVSVDSLQSYLEPDYSLVSIGSKCLARDTSDDIWYRATVVDILEECQYHVMFDANHGERKLEAQDIFPLTGHEIDDSSEEEREETRLAHVNDEDKEDLPVFLWRPGQTTDALGSWEKHTKGVASRIMARMGYIVGQGLGKNSEGRAEPVPIQLLPLGKSLDKIMELKALAGDRDLYDVLRKQRRKQASVDAAAADGYVVKKLQSSTPVFDFINVKLANKKSGNAKGLTKHAGGLKSSIDVKHIAAHDLNKKSDKHVNVQLYKTHEEMKNAEKEIHRIRIALERNEKQDQMVAKRLRDKLSSMQNYVEQLRTSESFIRQNQASRQARNSLTKF